MRGYVAVDDKMFDVPRLGRVCVYVCVYTSVARVCSRVQGMIFFGELY
jgi:hypothetical protein